MKKLFLVRHAKSSWDDARLADIDRPLGERGNMDVISMGQFLAKMPILPDIIISSPAVRAFDTAVALARAIAYEKEIEKNDKIYPGSPFSLWSVIQSLPNASASAMIVGHNPALTEFANELSDIYIDNIPTCGVLGVSWQKEKWNDIDKKGAGFLFFEYPKKLRR